MRVLVAWKFFVVALFHLSIGGTCRVTLDIIEVLLNSSRYSNKLRPLIDADEPLQISISINVNELSYISEVQMEYSMTCYIRQSWKDERLTYNDYNKSITLNHNQFDRLWTPDLFVRNLKSGTLHTITVPNRLIRISPDGVILFSQRITMTLVCGMILDMYPMDNQTCFIELGSYAYTTNDLIFLWNKTDPVQLDRMNLPEYTITDVTSETCTKSFTTGSFPCLRANFHLQRRLQAYLLTTYLPSFLIVLLSWLSFWIDPDSTPARTSLSILTILTVTTQSSSLVKSTPTGSFTKASDVWMATCLVFVFAAFIEYSIVNTLLMKQKRTKSGRMEDKKDKSVEEIVSNAKVEKKCFSGTKFLNDVFSSDPASSVEMASRITFPLLFLIFNVIYWPYYLTTPTKP